MGGTYRDLRVWRSAMELTVTVYRATQKFPSHETYGLSAQLRRAAVSVASNIAEGKGRSSDKELLQFLSRARGSLYEVQTQIELAQLLGYIAPADHQDLPQQAEAVGRMLNGMIAKFKLAVEESARPKAQSPEPKAERLLNGMIAKFRQITQQSVA